MVRPHIQNRQAERSDHKDYRRPGGESGEHVGRGTRAKGGLRSLSTECACQVSGAALLEEHYSDEKQAYDYVYRDNEVEENLHVVSYFPSLPGPFQGLIFGAEEGT